jgi:hypothetical protein
MFMKFCRGVLHKKSSAKRWFFKNWINYTLINGANEFLPVRPTFFENRCSESNTLPQGVNKILYSFFSATPRCLNFMCRRFGTQCLFHSHKWCKQGNFYVPTFRNSECATPIRGI